MDSNDTWQEQPPLVGAHTTRNGSQSSAVPSSVLAFRRQVFPKRKRFTTPIDTPGVFKNYYMSPELAINPDVLYTNTFLGHDAELSDVEERCRRFLIDLPAFNVPYKARIINGVPYQSAAATELAQKIQIGLVPILQLVSQSESYIHPNCENHSLCEEMDAHLPLPVTCALIHNLLSTPAIDALFKDMSDLGALVSTALGATLTNKIFYLLFQTHLPETQGHQLLSAIIGGGYYPGMGAFERPLEHFSFTRRRLLGKMSKAYLSMYGFMAESVQNEQPLGFMRLYENLSELFAFTLEAACLYALGNNELFNYANSQSGHTAQWGYRAYIPQLNDDSFQKVLATLCIARIYSQSCPFVKVNIVKVPPSQQSNENENEKNKNNAAKMYTIVYDPPQAKVVNEEEEASQNEEEEASQNDEEEKAHEALELNLPRRSLIKQVLDELPVGDNGRKACTVAEFLNKLAAVDPFVQTLPSSITKISYCLQTMQCTIGMTGYSIRCNTNTATDLESVVRNNNEHVELLASINTLMVAQPAKKWSMEDMIEAQFKVNPYLLALPDGGGRRRIRRAVTELSYVTSAFCPVKYMGGLNFVLRNSPADTGLPEVQERTPLLDNYILSLAERNGTINGEYLLDYLKHFEPDAYSQLQKDRSGKVRKEAAKGVRIGHPSICNTMLYKAFTRLVERGKLIQEPFKTPGRSNTYRLAEPIKVPIMRRVAPGQEFFAECHRIIVLDFLRQGHKTLASIITQATEQYGVPYGNTLKDKVLDNPSFFYNATEAYKVVNKAAGNSKEARSRDEYEIRKEFLEAEQAAEKAAARLRQERKAKLPPVPGQIAKREGSLTYNAILLSAVAAGGSNGTADTGTFSSVSSVSSGATKSAGQKREVPEDQVNMEQVPALAGGKKKMQKRKR